MGSFCQTCAITHMAIEWRDPVVGFVLSKSYAYRASGVTGYTGSVPFWQAVSLPFRGRYDDYGFVDVEKLDRAHAPMSLKAATGVDFAAIEKGADDGEDVEVDLGHPYGKSKLMTMFVHADVYETLTAKTPGRIGDPKIFAAEAARLDEFLADAARIAEKWSIPPAEGESFFDLTDFLELWTKDTGRKWTEMPEVANFFTRNRCDAVHPKLRFELTARLGRLHGQGKIEEARAVLADCLRTVFLDTNMKMLRRQWQPQGGLGSQDTAYALHAEVAAITAKRCETRSSEDYDGPEDDEEENYAPPSP